MTTRRNVPDHEFYLPTDLVKSLDFYFGGDRNNALLALIVFCLIGSEEGQTFTKCADEMAQTARIPLATWLRLLPTWERSGLVTIQPMPGGDNRNPCHRYTLHFGNEWLRLSQQAPEPNPAGVEGN